MTQPNKPEILLMRGIPGSGKSTYARKLAAEGTHVRVNLDDLRLMMGMPQRHDKSLEKIALRSQEKIIEVILASGRNVVVDNTHISDRHVTTYRQMATRLGATFDIKSMFGVPVEECFRRNALREGSARVPDHVIVRMAREAGLDLPEDTDAG